MKVFRLKKYTAVGLLLLLGCATENATMVQKEKDTDPAAAVVSAVKAAYAPDKRVALFDVEAAAAGEQLVLRGESNLPAAVAALKSELDARKMAYIDSIQMLPHADLEGKVRGLVTISVANLRSNPRHSAELATQATLGTPLKVLKKDDGWYLVQTPDDYLAWVDYGGLVTLNEEDFAAWHAAEKLIYLKPYGFSYERPDAAAPTVSDLVMGSILEISEDGGDFYGVKYPDGATAWIAKNDARPYQEWLASLNPSGSSLVSTSFAFKGLPYLWGGTSFKGVDCSGFTKTVYFLNGMVIPRDASQQIHTGELVDATRDFSKLLPGDLLFFGRPATDSSPERVVHVGMWIGNNEFIHSAGKVHISSVDSTAENFDRYNYNRYLRTKRLLQQNDPRLIQLSNSTIFK
ncbi:NlpC/P60 family protein [Cesiribacter sp. SM1]|uniref:C40 family peptidase n=1 Tax=Cesiribacter sp. SM1 TaxID=2861196 RepID=UPI001CD7809C|nr:NlpC/P60 family protein [Cesiribacter sp. SM1]